MRSRSRRSGFVLVTMTAGALTMTGMLGMAFDIGRMYIAKSELQSFADAAALAAALRLDGQSTGITRARNEVSTMRSAYRWNLGGSQLAAGNVTLEFAQSINNGPPVNWSSNPGTATNYSFARITVHGNLPIYFMAAVRGATHSDIGASATAGNGVEPWIHAAGHVPIHANCALRQRGGLRVPGRQAVHAEVVCVSQSSTATIRARAIGARQ